MKKIMFNDRYGLTEAVLSGRKTQKRQIITCPKTFKGQDVRGFCVQIQKLDDVILAFIKMCDAYGREIKGAYIQPKYKVGEVVAVAQSYKSLFEEDCRRVKEGEPMRNVTIKNVSDHPGWSNKMFVRGDQMFHQIRITNVRVERLQDISDENCFKEGVLLSDKYASPYGIADAKVPNGMEFYYSTPREAYAAMIDRIAGRGTFESNPWVFVYDFELIK